MPVKWLHEKLANLSRKEKEKWVIGLNQHFLFFFFLSCISATFIHLSLEHEEKYIYFVTGASLPTTVPHKNNNVTYISKYNF